MRARVVSVLGVLAIGRAGAAWAGSPAASSQQLIHIDVPSAPAGAATFTLPVPTATGAETAA